MLRLEAERADPLCAEIFRDYLANLRHLEKPGAATAVTSWKALEAALRWQDRNTPAVFETPSAPPPRDIHLSRAEFVTLRDAVADWSHLLVFLELAKSTGARAGAILGLTWTRVEFERGVSPTNIFNGLEMLVYDGSDSFKETSASGA